MDPGADFGSGCVVSGAVIRGIRAGMIQFPEFWSVVETDQ